MIKVQDIVSPAHTGEDNYRRKNNWNVYKGRVLNIFTEGTRTMAVIAWFRDAKDAMPRTYPIDLLKKAN